MKILFQMIFFTSYLFSQTVFEPTFIYGVTIENVNKNLPETVEALSKLSKKPTTRIVFDHEHSPSHYINAVKEIKKVSYIMGEVLDSYDMSKLSDDELKNRMYVYYKSFSSYIDIWEIGNEVNGEWNGKVDNVISKIKFANNYIRYKGGKTALTLYYNHECYEKKNHEMFTWVNKYLPSKIRDNLDYVLVSYYEDGCNSYQPDWQNVFDSLHVLFPKSKLGIGECGTRNKNLKEDYIEKYYSLRVTTPNFIGGYFWWYFRQDCVPYTKPLWNVINDAIK